MRAQRARAVVLVGSRSDNTAGQGRRCAPNSTRSPRSGGRAACIGQDLLGVDTVLPENRAGADALARALAALGHRRFAVLAGPRPLLTAQDRADGFRTGCAPGRCRSTAARVVHGELSRDGGYAAMSEILAAGEPLPDCVFAVSDIMAVGALARLRAAGLDVPGDIALAGLRRHPHAARRLPAAHHGAAAAQAARRDRRPAGARRRRAGQAAGGAGAGRGGAAGQHAAAAAGAR